MQISVHKDYARARGQHVQVILVLDRDTPTAPGVTSISSGAALEEKQRELAFLDKISSFRQKLGLDQHSLSLLYADDVSGEQLNASTNVSNLDRILYNRSVEYYQRRMKHLELALSRISRPEQVHYRARLYFKLAYYAALAGHGQLSITNFNHSYSALEALANTWSSPSSSPFVREAKTIAEYITVKVITAFLTVGTPVALNSAISSFLKHIRTWEEVLGDTDYIWEHYDWLSKQHVTMCELLQFHLPRSTLTSKPMLNPSNHYSSAYLYARKSRDAAEKMGILRNFDVSTRLENDGIRVDVSNALCNMGTEEDAKLLQTVNIRDPLYVGALPIVDAENSSEEFRKEVLSAWMRSKCREKSFSQGIISLIEVAQVTATVDAGSGKITNALRDARMKLSLPEEELQNVQTSYSSNSAFSHILLPSASAGRIGRQTLLAEELYLSGQPLSALRMLLPIVILCRSNAWKTARAHALFLALRCAACVGFVNLWLCLALEYLQLPDKELKLKDFDDLKEQTLAFLQGCEWQYSTREYLAPIELAASETPIALHLNSICSKTGGSGIGGTKYLSFHAAFNTCNVTFGEAFSLDLSVKSHLPFSFTAQEATFNLHLFEGDIALISEGSAHFPLKAKELSALRFKFIHSRDYSKSENEVGTVTAIADQANSYLVKLNASMLQKHLARESVQGDHELVVKLPLDFETHGEIRIFLNFLIPGASKIPQTGNNSSEILRSLFSLKPSQEASSNTRFLNADFSSTDTITMLQLSQHRPGAEDLIGKEPHSFIKNYLDANVSSKRSRLSMLPGTMHILWYISGNAEKRVKGNTSLAISSVEFELVPDDFSTDGPSPATGSFCGTLYHATEGSTIGLERTLIASVSRWSGSEAFSPLKYIIGGFPASISHAIRVSQEYAAASGDTAAGDEKIRPSGSMSKSLYITVKEPECLYSVSVKVEGGHAMPSKGRIPNYPGCFTRAKLCIENKSVASSGGLLKLAHPTCPITQQSLRIFISKSKNVLFLAQDSDTAQIGQLSSFVKSKGGTEDFVALPESLADGEAYLLVPPLSPHQKLTIPFQMYCPTDVNFASTSNYKFGAIIHNVYGKQLHGFPVWQDSEMVMKQAPDIVNSILDMARRHPYALHTAQFPLTAEVLPLLVAKSKSLSDPKHPLLDLRAVYGSSPFWSNPAAEPCKCDNPVLSALHTCATRIGGANDVRVGTHFQIKVSIQSMALVPLFIKDVTIEESESNVRLVGDVKSTIASQLGIVPITDYMSTLKQLGILSELQDTSPADTSPTPSLHPCIAPNDRLDFVVPCEALSPGVARLGNVVISWVQQDNTEGTTRIPLSDVWVHDPNILCNLDYSGEYTGSPMLLEIVNNTPHVHVLEVQLQKYVMKKTGKSQNPLVLTKLPNGTILPQVDVPGPSVYVMELLPAASKSIPFDIHFPSTTSSITVMPQIFVRVSDAYGLSTIPDNLNEHPLLAIPNPGTATNLPKYDCILLHTGN